MPELISTGVREEETAGEKRPVSFLPDDVVAVVLAPFEAAAAPPMIGFAPVVGNAAEFTPVLSAGCELTLVFPRALRRMAKGLLGTSVACATCGRSGVVSRLRLATKRRRR